MAEQVARASKKKMVSLGAFTSQEPGVDPRRASRGNAERAFVAITHHKINGRAACACCPCGANHPTRDATTRDAGHTAGVSGPRAGDEDGSRWQIHNG